MRAVEGVIQHDGSVCHGDGDADFLVCDCAHMATFVAMRKEMVAHKMIKVLEKEDKAASNLTHCEKIAAWHKSERYIKKYKWYVIMYSGRMTDAVAQSSPNILVSVKDHY